MSNSTFDLKSLSLSNIPRSNKNYLFAFIANHIIYYPTPISLTYAWSFGFLAGMCLLTQMISGIFLAMHYTPHVDLAFSSVEYIMRDVPNGWLLRYVHANGASMFFIVVYSHIFRGLYYGSYMKPRELLWCSGVVLFVLMMATAFTGYVLPWGQMSFWGATVITSMFTVIPFAGKAIVEWLWGGFTVNNPTLNRFFSIHFILPFLIAGVTLIHLALLHKDGSNNPIGSDAGIDDVPFYPYFVSKDMFAFFCFLFFFFTFVFYFPNTLNHPDNCIPADPMETPAHVVPEWYFLPFYAILRSIPNKAGGIVTMGGAIAVLFLIPFNNTSDIRNTTYRPIFRVCYWVLMASWVVLTWIGQCPVEDIFAFVGQIATVYYYVFFILLVPVVGKIESALAHYPENLPSKCTVHKNLNFSASAGFFQEAGKELAGQDPLLILAYIVGVGSFCAVTALFMRSQRSRENEAPRDRGPSDGPSGEGESLGELSLHTEITEPITNPRPLTENAVNELSTFEDFFRFNELYGDEFIRLFSLDRSNYETLLAKLCDKVEALLVSKLKLDNWVDCSIGDLSIYDSLLSILYEIPGSDKTLAGLAKLFARLHEGITNFELYDGLASTSPSELIEVIGNLNQSWLTIFEQALCSCLDSITSLGLDSVGGAGFVVCVFALDLTNQYGTHLPTIFKNVDGAANIFQLQGYDVVGNRSQEHFEKLFAKVSQLFTSDCDLNVQLNVQDNSSAKARVLSRIGTLKNNSYHLFYFWLLEFEALVPEESKRNAFKRIITELAHSNGGGMQVYDKYCLGKSMDSSFENYEWSSFEKAFFSHIHQAGLGFLYVDSVILLFLVFLGQAS